MKQPSMFYGAPPHVFEKARELRKEMTKAEEILWRHLKKKQLGCKFRRQHPIFEFVADFYCHRAKLVVELDGEYHKAKEQKTKDKERTKIMTGFGLKVLRFYNHQITADTANIINIIKKSAIKQKKSPL